MTMHLDFVPTIALAARSAWLLGSDYRLVGEFEPLPPTDWPSTV